jgi:hypothetical protein
VQNVKQHEGRRQTANQRSQNRRIAARRGGGQAGRPILGISQFEYRRMGMFDPLPFDAMGKLRHDPIDRRS